MIVSIYDLITINDLLFPDINSAQNSLLFRRFHCPNKGVNTINVRPYDALQFLCPMKDHNIDWHNEHGISSHFLHENAFLTDNETAMEQCDATSKSFLIENTSRFFKHCHYPCFLFCRVGFSPLP